MAEYEGLIAKLHAAVELGVRQLLAKGDSKLVVKQVHGECGCQSPQPTT
jgi:ribonuclease HI